jgi:hypothetical protein
LNFEDARSPARKPVCAYFGCDQVEITCSSRTAEIDMKQIIGVHGLGEVHAFLVDDTFTG